MSVPTAEQVFAFAQAQEQSPTVREVARKFRCSQQAIVDLVESAEAPRGAYFALAVARGCAGGYYEFECIGDYEVEAYV